jgi:hypothetical protein
MIVVGISFLAPPSRRAVGVSQIHCVFSAHILVRHEYNRQLDAIYFILFIIIFFFWSHYIDLSYFSWLLEITTGVAGLVCGCFLHGIRVRL